MLRLNFQKVADSVGHIVTQSSYNSVIIIVITSFVLIYFSSFFTILKQVLAKPGLEIAI